ncbi:MAG: hypothetical protein R3E89_08760 [Thiolinea sp.]
MIIRQIIEEGLIVNHIGNNAAEREALIAQALADVQMPREAMQRFPTSSRAASGSGWPSPGHWC